LRCINFFFKFFLINAFLCFVDVNPTTQIVNNQVSEDFTGTLLASDSGVIRHIAIFPSAPESILLDSALGDDSHFPTIEFGLSSQFMAPLPHRIVFPPNRYWSVDGFLPETVYWPSPEDSLFPIFQWAIPNYPSCLHHTPHETTDSYRRRIFSNYSRLFGSVEFMENNRRVDLYSGDEVSLEDVEREIGEFEFLFL
jgi:hypothetical protein